MMIKIEIIPPKSRTVSKADFCQSFATNKKTKMVLREIRTNHLQFPKHAPSPLGQVARNLETFCDGMKKRKKLVTVTVGHIFLQNAQIEWS